MRFHTDPANYGVPALADVKSLKIVPGSADVGIFLSGIKDSNSSRRSVTQPDEKESLNSKVSAVLVSDFTPKTLEQFLGVSEPAAVDFFDYKIVASTRPINNAAIIDAHTVNVTDNSLAINVTIANYGQTEQIRQLTAEIGRPDFGELSRAAAFDQTQRHRTPAYSAVCHSGASVLTG